MNVTLDCNAPELEEFFQEVGEKVFPQVEISSLNDAGRQSLTQARSETSKGAGIPVGKLRNRFALHKASKGRRQARIFIGTMPVSAIDLNARELKRGGVTYGGGGHRTKNPHAFIAQAQGGRAVFERVGRPRLPIKKVTVPIATHARRAVEHITKTFFPQKLNQVFASKFSYRVNQAIEKRRGVQIL